MRLPRDIKGSEPAKKLEKYGYRIKRQTGSHLRLSTLQNGEHQLSQYIETCASVCSVPS